MLRGGFGGASLLRSDYSIDPQSKVFVGECAFGKEAS